MSERAFFDLLLLGWFALAAAAFLLLQFLSAPYGRHERRGWGPTIPSRPGWVLMELPAVVVPLLCFLVSDRQGNAVAWVFFLAWQIHYVHRTLIYPFRMRLDGKRMPLLIAVAAFFTNIGVNYLNARWVFSFGPELGLEWFTDPRFIAGALLFVVGMGINRHSDALLRGLREPGETGYKIPRGGAYRWVSAPNYMGELLGWAGWALATWSLPGLAFFVWSAANLVPRALTNHRWYLERFPDYPSERKALIPFIL